MGTSLPGQPLLNGEDRWGAPLGARVSTIVAPHPVAQARLCYLVAFGTIRSPPWPSFCWGVPWLSHGQFLVFLIYFNFSGYPALCVFCLPLVC